MAQAQHLSQEARCWWLLMAQAQHLSQEARTW
jgi:hypothetical protein